MANIEKFPGVDADEALERFRRQIDNEEPHPAWLEMAREEEPQTETTANDDVERETADIAGTSERLRSTPQPFADMRGQRARTLRRKRMLRWGTAAAALAATAIMLNTTAGSKVMASMMQTFYVQHIQGISSNDLQDLTNALENAGVNGKQISLQKYGTLTVNGSPNQDTKIAPLSEANRATGYQVKSLNVLNLKGSVQAMYSHGSNMTFQLHVKPMNQLLKQIGAKTLFPADIDGKKISIEIPATVQQSTNGQGSGFTSFNVMQSPVIQVPSGVDVKQVRNALLSIPFLPSDIRHTLMQSQDWKDTLYLPVGDGAVKTSVDGNDAYIENSGNMSTIIWLHDGKIYQLQTDQIHSQAALIGAAQELTS